MYLRTVTFKSLQAAIRKELRKGNDVHDNAIILTLAKQLAVVPVLLDGGIPQPFAETFAVRSKRLMAGHGDVGCEPEIGLVRAFAGEMLDAWRVFLHTREPVIIGR